MNSLDAVYSLGAVIVILLVLMAIMTLMNSGYYSGRKTKNSKVPFSLNPQWGWNTYSIPIAIAIILISNGFFLGNNGLNSDYGLDYCVEGDDLYDSEPYYFEQKNDFDIQESRGSFEITNRAFFACELGHIDGPIRLAWYLMTPDEDELNQNGGVRPYASVMILNHENYRLFVNGEKYGYSNTDLASINQNGDVLNVVNAKYDTATYVHSDSYFFIVSLQYEASDSPQGPFYGKTTHHPNESEIYEFNYYIDLDYIE